jgi:hypothetical protein
MLISLLLVGSGAQAALTWQPAAPSPANAGAHQGHGGHRGGKAFQLQDGAGAEAQMWLPTRVRRPLHVAADGRVSVGGSGIDNYHLLFARKRTAAGEEVALRYLYQHGKPSGESPSSLLQHDKAMLDIVPAPLTREHQRYLSQKVFTFLIRFEGKPLAGQSVALSTSNGTSLRGKTDGLGRITLQLPDDFTDVQPGRRNNRPAEFVISTKHEAGGSQYQTTLSAPYYVSPSHWRSTSGGLMAMLAGALTGFVVLRRSRNANEKAGRA